MNQKIMANAPKVIKDFLGYLQTIKGKSPKTVDEYYLDLRTFFRFIKISKNLVCPNTPFNEITIEDITIDLIKQINLTDLYDYLNYVLTERNNNASTRSRKISSLKSFFKYLTNKTDLLEIDPTKELDMPKKKKSLPKFLTLEQSLDLLNCVNGIYHERDYCILTLFLNCGMRLSELVGINLNDIRNNNTLKVIGKGNKERIVYLNDACVNALQNYLKVRSNPNAGTSDKNALFISKRKKRISPKTVQALVYKYLNCIELDGQGYSVHKLRHTAATLMYQHGNVDIRILKDILGHANLGTTEIYTHLSSKQIEQAVSSNPLSKVKPR
ncbi:MAG: Tyrosine recombinase XerD [Eubacteriales bacterium SKADARSKE-1]|nr:Tyrosine recombinase XerD [Eubacteriales bacterium SKADARSKE-1]